MEFGDGGIATLSCSRGWCLILKAGFECRSAVRPLKEKLLKKDYSICGEGGFLLQAVLHLERSEAKIWLRKK